MKRYLLSLALLCLVATGAHAYWQSRAQVAIVTGGGGFALDYKSGSTSGVNATTINYGTMTWDSGKYLVLVLSFLENSAGTTVSSVTVDGVSLTQIAGARACRGAFTACIDMWITPSTMSSSTGNVSVTFSTSPNAFGVQHSVAVYSLSTTNPTPTDTDQVLQGGTSTTFTMSALTVPSGGGAIVATSNDNFTALVSWTGVTADPTGGGANNQNYGHTTATGTNTIVATWGSAQVGVMTGVAWGP